MSPTELRAQAMKQVDLLGAGAHILVVMPRRSRSAERKNPDYRLMAAGGPKGRVAGTEVGKEFVDFRAVDVLAWLDRCEGVQK